MITTINIFFKEIFLKKKTYIHSAQFTVKLLAMLLLFIQLPANSAQVEIANEPLVNALPPLALPNLMYILDNSLSMRWEHTPDWVAEGFCKSTSGVYDANCGHTTDAQYTAGNQLQDAAPPYRSSDFNSQYYNPTIRYTPPVNSMGVSLGNQSAGSTKKDYYDVIETGNINLVTGFSDIEWCTSSNECLRNDNYVLPGVVNGKFYNVMNETSATGTKTLAKSASITVSKALGPHYYKIIPGEFCDTTKLANCQAIQNEIFKFPAKLRWCNDKTLTNCQALKTGNFQYARYPTVTLPPGVSTITVGNNVSTSTIISSIKVDGKEILSAATATTGTVNTIASRIAANINACTVATPTGTWCNIVGFTATSSGSVVTLYAPISTTLFPLPVVTRNTSRNIAVTTFTGISKVVPGSFERVDIVNITGVTYPKTIGRTDCVVNTNSCTYTEEVTNFANWYSYYRTRIQMIKTSTSIAFKPIKEKFRIGMANINSFISNNLKAANNHYLRPAQFLDGAGSQKEKWYNSLFKAELQSSGKTTGTMLRSALANVGRLYAGKAPTIYNSSVTAGDPMQYSCQQNYTLLNTDGYWNVDTDADVKNIAGTGSVGQQDAGANDPPRSEGSAAVAASNTLADVAYYYYNTDLRTTANGNCIGSARPDGTTGDVCTNNVNTSTNDENNQQHMTTFTVGLGVDGSLDYVSDYKDAKSGDFFDIKNGNKSWPKPVAQTETAIDDLWHAAVNGNGSYFSAKDPNVLGASLTKALTEINSTIGAAAAAATSTLNPVSGDNVAFLASYATSQWTGNIEARAINTESGLINPDALWCAEDIGEEKCGGDKSVETLNNSTVNYCSTANSTAAKCDEVGGTFVAATNKCKVTYATSCTGTMTQATRANIVTPSTTVVAALEDNRTIYMKDTATIPAAGGLVSFKYNNLSAAQKVYFGTTFLSDNLSHWNLLSSAQQDIASGENLVNYLRGQNGFDDRETNLDPTTDNRLFRKREAVLGDVLESKPAFIGKTTSRYLDLGYANFQAAKATREGTVYVAANDGMLHAFDATTGSNAGKERWAFVPSAVIPELYKLADKNYSANHKNYLNGDIIISDICSANCDNATAIWKTILVAGQNGGGKSYYALDITDPDVPKLMWEFSNLTSTTTVGVNYDVGYTFGVPVVTKLPDGTWVVLLTSGYNNTAGKGHLFVLNANTGNVLNDYVTSAGDSTTPSGLAKISAFAVKPDQDNTSLYAYGGDLLGNLWRFDLSSAPSVSNPLLFATLQAGSVVQPITTAPEIGIINDTRVIFVGTGKYLGSNDLNNKDQQTLYAIKDDNATATLFNPRNNAGMVKQVISEPTIGTRTVASTQPVEWSTKRGWYIDLPASSGERQNVQSQLVLGTLLVSTIVPTAGACSPGGEGWLYSLNYLTGGPVAGSIIGRRTSSPIVGINVVYINGVPKTSIVRSDGTIELRDDVVFNQSVTGFKKKRVIWRELIDAEQ